MQVCMVWLTNWFLFMKLSETILIALALGSLLLWILEVRRTSFAESYWILMVCLAFLFSFQFVRNRRLEREKIVSPTIKQMEADRNRKKKKK
ncbi:hypothetical protein BN8_04483 [Fibrisoma limi BUZ 3]|uniref:Uncharacterized protein n=2 Tax=Fibrisoma limi TaxID=663275 RepID=I2GMW1_9BACT|nr:hypothetical protein BN8_04483 [Fibrisoma limi BUZ 3]